jgi:hypothetical protein
MILIDTTFFRNDFRQNSKTVEQALQTYRAIKVFAQITFDAMCSLIVTQVLFQCDLLGIAGTTILILFIRQMNWLIIIIVVDIVVFVMVAYSVALEWQTKFLTISKLLLKLVQPHCSKSVHRSLVPIRSYFSHLFQFKESTKLTIYGIIFENIGSFAILLKSYI